MYAIGDQTTLPRLLELTIAPYKTKYIKATGFTYEKLQIYEIQWQTPKNSQMNWEYI